MGLENRMEPSDIQPGISDLLDWLLTLAVETDADMVGNVGPEPEDTISFEDYMVQRERAEDMAGAILALHKHMLAGGEMPRPWARPEQAPLVMDNPN